MRFLPLFLLTVAGCHQSPRESSAPPEPSAAIASPSHAYAIRGQERPNWGPGWSAVIQQNRLVLDSPTSAGWYAVRLSEPRVEPGRRSYDGGNVRLVVEEGACVLPQLRRSLPDRVLLDWDAGHFEGCGGPRGGPSQISGTSWELLRIGREAAPNASSPAAVVTFGPDGAIHGTEGCNDTSADVRWKVGGFEPLPAEGRAMTAMGCADQDASAFASRFWSRLRKATGWQVRGERLYISFEGGLEAELGFLL